MSHYDFLDKIKKPFGNSKPTTNAASGSIDKPLNVKAGGNKTVKTKNVTRVASKASGARGGGGGGGSKG